MRAQARSAASTFEDLQGKENFDNDTAAQVELIIEAEETEEALSHITAWDRRLSNGDRDLIRYVTKFKDDKKTTLNSSRKTISRCRPQKSTNGGRSFG